MPTAAASETVTPKVRALEVLRFARSVTAGMLKDFPADKGTFQASPTDNHVVWNLGHLASTYQWMAGMLDGKPKTLPESYDALFGGKSAPSPDARKYPSFAEVRREYDRALDRFIAAFEATPDGELHSPAIGETYGFVSDRLDAVYKAAWHEGWHVGQISSVRRALNLPRTMG